VDEPTIGELARRLSMAEADVQRLQDSAVTGAALGALRELLVEERRADRDTLRRIEGAIADVRATLTDHMREAVEGGRRRADQVWVRLGALATAAGALVALIAWAASKGGH